MGLIFDFFKDINDEVNRGIARDKADIICEEAYEYLTNNEYPPEEIFVRNGKGSPPFMLFESKDINNLACLTLVAALTKGMENRENSVSFESVFSEVLGVYNHMAEMELTNLDLENKKEYLSNKEFLEKYNFEDEAYEFIDAMKEALKIEVTRMAAICSYLDTIIHFSELFNEYFSNFEKEGKIQNPIYYLPFDYSFEGSVTRIIKEAFFMYQYRNISYFENNMGEIEDLSDNHPKSEIENPYSMYDAEKYEREDRCFHPYSYKELEKEFELFYIDDDMEAIRDFNQGLKKIFNKKISAHWFAIESLKEKISQHRALRQGEDGENYAYNYLREHLPDNWIVLQNINTPYKDSQRENDIIVINEKGVFTLEVKNYIGGSLEIKNDGKVIHKRSGEIVDDKQDIIEQSENHVTALTAFLEKNYPLEDMNWHDLVKGIVVISNDEMNIKNDSTYPIFRTSLVRPYILNMQNNVLSKNQIEDIKDLMIRTSKEDLKFPYMAFIDEFYQEDFLLAVTNKSVQFFEYYLEILDGVVDPINLSQSLVFYPVINDMGEFEIVTNEKDAGELKEKLKIIFNEENKDLVLDILTNNL